MTTMTSAQFANSFEQAGKVDPWHVNAVYVKTDHPGDGIQVEYMWGCVSLEESTRLEGLVLPDDGEVQEATEQDALAKAREDGMEDAA